MTNHKWEIEVIDGGSVGLGEFWKCNQCGASGGPTLWPGHKNSNDVPTWRPFLAGTHLKLTDDCSQSLEIIKKFELQKLEEEANKKAKKMKKQLKNQKRAFKYAKVFKASDMPLDVKNEFLEIYNNGHAEFDEYVDWNTAGAKDLDCIVAKWLIEHGAGRDEVVLIRNSQEREIMQ